MPTGSFHSARLKVERAVRHVNELQAVIATFLKTDFHRVWIDVDPQTGEHIVRYETAPAPQPVPLIIGDAIHNLHTTLDHIASDIAERAGLNSNRVHFPKHETRDALEKSREFREIVQAAPNLSAVILDEIRPYKAGNYPLWALGKLDNVDKHKLLIPTVAITKLTGLSAIDSNYNFLSDVTVIIDAGGRMDIAGFGRPSKITENGKPSFDITFPKGSYFELEPIVPTLLQLTQLVKGVIDTLEAHYFG